MEEKVVAALALSEKDLHRNLPAGRVPNDERMISPQTPSSCLLELPVEILSSIISYVDIVRTLLHLSLTCRRLHVFIEKEGFRTFVLNRFPSVQTPPYWKDAANALTSLSRAWDRWSLLAELTRPQYLVMRLPRGRENTILPRGSRRQTMGYQPVIDSYEEQTGANWTSRREVLAWGAGAELIVRLTNMGEETEKEWQHASRSRTLGLFEKPPILQYDRYHHQVTWMTYKESWQSDGKGDITSVNLLRPWQDNVLTPSKSSLNGADEIIVGRANGDLHRIALSANRSKSRIISRYITNGRSVQSASLSTASKPILAACLSDSTIAIYSIQSSNQDLNPEKEISVLPDGKSGKVWSTRFLAPERLAIGLGRSTEPIHIYEISPHGVSDIPLRKFGLPNPSSAGASVYPLAPIGPSSKASGGAGVTFLSGWYDGSIRLHDLRSPTLYTAIYNDPMDSSPIYSLLPLARERFLAGGARHSIVKGFDLRMSGGRVYFAADADPCIPDASQTSETTARSPHSYCCTYHYHAHDAHQPFNLFLSIDPRNPNGSRARFGDSPVYSLSSPSSYSPRVFAGLENRVTQIDLVSLMEKHSDPIFKYGLVATGRDYVACQQAKLPHVRDKFLNVALQVQKAPGKMRLLRQAGFGERIESIAGLDERWMDVGNSE